MSEEDGESPDLDPIWGQDFIDTYLEYGDRFSVDNDTLHLGFMLALLGQSVGDAKFYIGDDENHCRIHPFMIQDSGTGKDPAFEFAKNIAHFADIKFSDSNDLTNAGLVGTFEDGEPVKGAAARYDVLGFREAMELIKSANPDWNENFSENLNGILDGSKVERQMASGTIEFEPDCTVVGTSYPPSDDAIDVENLMRNGTLARFLYFYKDVPPGHRFDINSKLADRLGGNPDGRMNRITEIADTLLAIRGEIGYEGVTFTFEIDEEQLDEKVRAMIESSLDSSSMEASSSVEPAITRYFIHTVRVACLMAALDECSTVVRDRHVEQALEIIELSWEQMLDFFENYYTDDSKSEKLKVAERTLTIQKELKEAGGELTQNELKDKLDVSRPTARSAAKLLVDEGLIEESGGHRGKEKTYTLSME